MFGAGAAVYVASYVTFAVNQHAWPVLLVAFALAGIGIRLAEAAETTTVALMLPDRLRGNGFGVFGLVQSCGDLGATVVAGLWGPCSRQPFPSVRRRMDACLSAGRRGRATTESGSPQRELIALLVRFWRPRRLCCQ